MRPHARDEFLIQRDRRLRFRRVRKTGTPLFQIGIQRELRDDEHAAADVRKREIHLARRIGKDAQMHDLLRETRRVRLRILRRNAEENQIPAVDLTAHLAVDADIRRIDPRHHRAHVTASLPVVMCSIITRSPRTVLSCGKKGGEQTCQRILIAHPHRLARGMHPENRHADVHGLHREECR